MEDNLNLLDQNKLPELKLGKTLIWFLYILQFLIALLRFLGIFILFWFCFVLDAKQAQGFLSFYKTLPQVSLISYNFSNALVQL